MLRTSNPSLSAQRNIATTELRFCRFFMPPGYPELGGEPDAGDGGSQVDVRDTRSGRFRGALHRSGRLSVSVRPEVFRKRKNEIAGAGRSSVVKKSVS